MYASAPRTVLHAQRALRISGSRFAAARRSASSTTTTQGGSGSGALVGGLVGGGLVFAGGFAWYHFSGVRDAVSTAHQAKSYINKAIHSANNSLPDKAPSGSEAIQIIRDTATKYAAFIPGGKGYVDSAFRDIESVRDQHGEEVDKIVREAYDELYQVSKKGFSIETASQTVDVLTKHTSRLTSLAGDAAGDVLANHPELQKKLGASAEQLKGLRDRLAPEAKQKFNEVIKSGNVSEVVDKIRTAIFSGKLDDLEKYIKQFKGDGKDK